MNRVLFKNYEVKLSFFVIKNLYIKYLNGLALKYSFLDFILYLVFILQPFTTKKRKPKVSLRELKFEVVVISLSFRKDRRDYILKHLGQLNMPFIFFDAIHGQSEINKLYKSVNFSLQSKKYLSNGSKGCIASHISLWKELKESCCEAYLIFEDDIVINKSYSELLNELGDIPNDFDLIYLGSGSCKSFVNMRKFSSNLTVPFSVRKGAYSYILTKKGAEKILNEIGEINITCGGIDTILGLLTMRRKINVYHLMPSLCQVDFSFASNIINPSLNHKVIDKNEF